MTQLATITKTALTLAPFVAAALTAALTTTVQYDPAKDELVIRVRKLQPAIRALAPLRARALS